MERFQTRIVEFNDLKHRNQVIELWQKVFGYEAAHNSPEVVIDKKIQNKDDLFYVAENKLTSLGCLKVNLQIMEENETVQRFYITNGFSVEKRVSMGKKLY
jgi:hypothetical protein